MIFVDALSRQAAHRKLPKTMEWLKKEGYLEFFRYHSVAPNTFPNALAFLYGLRPENLTGEPPKERWHNIIDTFKQNGYVTGHSADTGPSPWTLALYPQQSKYITDYPADHEGLSFQTDPHYLDHESTGSVVNGPYSIFRRCLYGKDAFQQVLDYGKSFFQAYKNDRKLLYLEFLDQHEPTAETITLLDEPLAEYLQGLPKDTSVMLFADHGYHMVGLGNMLGTWDFTLERALPLLMMKKPALDPKSLEHLEANQQKLVSHLELHQYWKYLATGVKEQGRQNLAGPISSERSCWEVPGPLCSCFRDNEELEFRREDTKP